MRTEVLVALLALFGVLVTAGAGVWVAVIQNRKTKQVAADTAQVAADTAQVVAQVTNNGGSSMKDTVDYIRTTVDDIRKTQGQHGERLTAVEVRLADHLRAPREVSGWPTGSTTPPPS